MTYLLTAAEVDQLRGIKFTLPKLLERGLTGRHQATQKGSSVEFSQHRDYAPGDPIKHLDWKAFARSEKYVIKEFESESNLNVLLILDRSTSMAFKGESAGSKQSFASRLIHGFTWLLLQQGDSVGLATFSDDEPTYVPPSSAGHQLHRIEEELKKTETAGSTSFEQVVEFINIHCRSNTVCIFFSDLLDNESVSAQRMVQLKKKRYATYCIHLLAAEEHRLTGSDPTIYKDEETGEDLLSEPLAIKAAYDTAIDEWLHSIRTECHHHGIPYVFSTTDAAPVSTILAMMGHQS
jgi:uncharacterized protein (DUF58 family)